MQNRIRGQYVKFVIGLMGLGKCIFDISLHLFSTFEENIWGFCSGVKSALIYAPTKIVIAVLQTFLKIYKA